ncbi:MAG TPA: inner membrane CreD family protein, partial [Xanthomonadaceae bacterium]|nr:inner membrane CreD family protein [Xanthomonadaceae bacterium]
MRNSLLLKCLVIGLLILAIMIPLGMIENTVAERQSFDQQAVTSVEQGFAGAQTLVGPVVVVPYLADVPITVNDSNGVPHSQVRAERGVWTFFPKTVAVDGSLAPEFKHRGIHQVLTYEMGTDLKGHFDIVLPTEVSGATLRSVGKPCLSFGIDDVRGLIGTPTLSIDGRPTALLQGAGGERRASGVHADLPALAAGQSRSFGVAMDFTLGGTERIAIAPVGDSNRIELKSTWPSPDFEGRFSPHQPVISASGFDATWDISALAANTQGQYADGGMKDGA